MRQRTETQATAIRNQLLMNNYRTLQEKTREQSAMRHEIRHHLTALESLCKSQDYEQMSELLERLKGENEKSSHHTFTENETLNIILQDIAQRAEKEQISFTPRIQVPTKLNIPTDDLCSFVIGIKVGKAIRSGLMIGVGFVGLSLIVDMMNAELGPAAQAMSERFGLSFLSKSRLL